MKLFGIGKVYLYGLIFFVLPVGGMVLNYHMRAHGYSFMLSVDKGHVVVGECSEVSGFSEYLNELNGANKPRNIVCEFSGEVTTMSKGIECHILHGTTMAYFYWAETIAECNRVKEHIKK